VYERDQRATLGAPPDEPFEVGRRTRRLLSWSHRIVVGGVVTLLATGGWHLAFGGLLPT
jgi:hypothetical protein